MSTSPLLSHRTDNWLTLELNRPNARNALSEPLIDALSDALGAVANEDSVRGITLRGAGKVFCAGGDLKGFQALHNGDKDALRRSAALSRKTGALLARIVEQPQPVIASVHGAAIAGGLGLMAAADIAVATHDTRFALTETRLGIVPAQIAPWIAARTGLPTARRLMLTGAQFDAVRGYEMNLVDEYVDDRDALEERVARIQSQVLKCAPQANRRTKKLLRTMVACPTEAFIDVAADEFTAALDSDEGRSGIASFLEMTTPEWQRD